VSTKDADTIKWAKYSGLRLIWNFHKESRKLKKAGKNSAHLRHTIRGARFVLESLYGLSEARKRVAERGLAAK
jgi:hypothetical protein